MKAKIYSVILSALLLAALPAKAQFADTRDFRNNDAGLVVNNYYDDNDYYYSSRINRFHKSYAAFDYYSPVFTETYWYSYQPYSWGVSIYGRSGGGFGFSSNYPVYYYGWGTDYWYDHNYGWYDPYYGSSYYWGYDPYYYSWYSPVIVNINVGYNWRSNHYWNWYGQNHLYHNHRPVYHTTNNYYYNNYSGDSYRTVSDRGKSGQYYRTPPSAKRESVPAAGSGTRTEREQGARTATGRPVNNNRGNEGNSGNAGNAGNNSNNGNTGNNGNSGNAGNSGNSDNNSNNGNNQNSRPGGNNGNFDQNDRNTNNNGNNNNSQPGGNNGKFGDKSNERKVNTVSQGRSSSAGSAARSSGSSTKTRSSSSSKSSSGSSSKSDEKRSSRSGR
jgi:hypothetical protein